MSLLALVLFGCGGLDVYGPRQPGAFQSSVLGRQRDPVGAILDRAEGLPADLRYQKFCAMSAGPFPFYRATAHVYYADLFHDPARNDFRGPVTWLSGDAHPQNFGAFDDDEGRVVYDLNDFDESFVGDAQLDLWRLAAGTALLGSHLGFDADDREDAVDHVVDGWLDALADHAEDHGESSFQLTEDNAWGRLDEFLEAVAEDNDREDMLEKWTEDGLLDLQRPGVEPAPPELVQSLHEAWPSYVGGLDTGLAGEWDWFTIKDVAIRVGAGLGSYGTPRLVVLVEGPSDDDDDDRLLDVKQQALPSVWSELDDGSRGLLDPVSARRVIVGHAALLAEADDHLGWLMLDGASWSVRERSPFKETVSDEWIDTPKRFRKVAEQWGYVLGTAHARADVDADAGVLEDFEGSMLAVIGDEEDLFRSRVIEVGLGYAEVVRTDHAAFIDQVGCPSAD